MERCVWNPVFIYLTPFWKLEISYDFEGTDYLDMKDQRILTRQRKRIMVGEDQLSSQ